jgi:hypothetical protein
VQKARQGVNSKPMSKTCTCTNDSKNITRSQETRVGTVGSGEGKDSQSTTRTRKWGHGGSEEAEEEDDDDDVELLAIAQAAQAAEVTLEPAKFRGKRWHSCTSS